ncbi:hypothetical protein G6011_07809 [Alternaria panax]|uniref:RRM domain-containing protein n=1 Tax=Alternaria panax TaxID=48097 RepID=A0AAD4I169_9PLEO|nr:hypothetical protein G6011_07809 [Alternaria panax]
MSESAHSLGTPPATDTSTPTAADEQPALPARLNNPVKDPVNDATRDPNFVPGAGQGFFSTGLGVRTPRSLGDIRPPVIARSVQDPAAVVQAASYWQIKYKSQCLCILPLQGWTVEDLWDAEDLHVEGRRFCEEMLTFISRSTYYWADRFARDWARAHPDRVDFTGLDMGSVYDINDSLEVIDKIFIFGEPIDFPRVFLWHVAYILVGTWIETNKTIDATLRMSLMPQTHAGCQNTTSTEAAPSSTLVDVSDKKKTKSSPAVAKLHLPTIMTSGASDPRHTQPLPQRVPSQGHIQPAGHPGLMRSGNAGIAMGPSRVSPIIHAQPLIVPKNRNMGCESYGQPPGWIENNNRTMYGSYPRQPSVGMPSMQSPSFLSPQMAVGQHIPQPVIPGLSPYIQVAHTGYGFQQPDPGMMTRAHINYQQGIMQTQPMNPTFPHQPNGQQVSMADMTNNMHHANSIMYQHQDPRAPMPRRPDQRNAQDLFDPYGGNNPKFNGAPGYNNGGRKGGNNSFVPQPGRGRKVSNMSGRDAYSRSNADYNAKVPPGGPRNPDLNARRRLSEDDPTITGDSVFGCGHTWIGPKNSTVNELWIGDLPSDVGEDELVQLFKQTVGVTPIAISLRSRFPQDGTHAFATFASSAEAQAALGIKKSIPHLRGGRVTVTVPRRFFRKDTPPTLGYFDQTHTGQAADHTIRNITRTLNQHEERAVEDANSDPAAANDKALYSPQDARSGLSKMPPTESATTDHLGMGSTKPEMPKRQQKSPTKKNKGKGKRESPVNNINSADEITKIPGRLNVDGSATIEEEQTSTDFINTVAQITKPASVDAATLAPELLVSGTAASRVVDHSANPARNLTLQLSEKSEAAEFVHDDEEFPTEPMSDASPALTGIQSEVLETTSDTIPTAEEYRNTNAKSHNTLPKESSLQVAYDSISEDEAKNDTSFHSAPEVQSEAMQLEPQSTSGDKAAPLKHDFSESLLVATETEPCDPQTLHTQGSFKQFEEPASVWQKETATSQVPNLDTTQEPAASTRTHTAPASTLDSVATSTAGEVSPNDVAKKAGALQMQSLHPFAKNKAQAKKEREAKKKQQKKEDADRIAKAKAEKAASSKKPYEDLNVHSNTGLLTDRANSPTATNAVAKPEVAHSSPNGGMPTGNRKSKGKAKAPLSGVVSADREKKVNNEEETGKLDGIIKDSKEIPSVTHKAENLEALDAEPVKEESLDRFGAAWGTEPTPSRAPPAPPMTPKAQAPSQKMPPQEVNDPHNFTSNQPTHITGPQVPPIDSHPGLTLPPSTTNIHVRSQHNTSPQEYMSRSSSPSTLVGDENQMSPLLHPMPSPNFSEPSQHTFIATEALQLDAAPTAAPKKKKKKFKKNKKTAAFTTDPAQPTISGDTPGSTGTEEEYHTYDPFASQMSHIDAIRRAVKYDTSSYVARTNARIEKDIGEREEAGQSPKASKFCSTCKGDVAKMCLQVEMEKWAAQIEAYWDDFPDARPEVKKVSPSKRMLKLGRRTTPLSISPEKEAGVIDRYCLLFLMQSHGVGFLSLLSARSGTFNSRG